MFPFLVTKCLPWVLSALSLGTAWLAGSADRRAWIVGMASQSAWAFYAIYTRAFGLLPTFVFLFLIYARNWRKARPEVATA